MRKMLTTEEIVFITLLLSCFIISFTLALSNTFPYNWILAGIFLFLLVLTLFIILRRE